MKNFAALLGFPSLIFSLALLWFLFGGEPDVIDTYRDYIIDKYEQSEVVR